MVEALFREDESDADDVAGRRLLVGHALSQCDQGSRHRRSPESCPKNREKPVEEFFARNGRLREDNLMVHDLWLVQVKSPQESKYPWDYYKILTTISGTDAFGPPNPDCPLVKK